jgi:hypothetical protein
MPWTAAEAKSHTKKADKLWEDALRACGDYPPALQRRRL